MNIKNQIQINSIQKLYYTLVVIKFSIVCDFIVLLIASNYIITSR